MHSRWSLFALALVLGTTGIAYADPSDTQAKIEALQKQMDAVKAQLDELKAAQAQRQAAPAAPAAAQTQAQAAPDGSPWQLKKGDGLTFLNGKKDEVTVYGHLDLSTDLTTKGLHRYYATSSDSPAGNVGWLSAISSNLSYFGIRGRHNLGPSLGLVYQLETQLDLSSMPGNVESNSNNDGIVKGGLTSRNSFVGFGNKSGGFVKIGKTDAPYKNTTARMNPFSGELGDYSVVMANTGGDNRVEFGTRIDHALWYESPQMGGFTVNLLVSPGQNRGTANSIIAAGEPGCTGGNLPASGATPPTCSDGSFGTAYSGSVAYQNRRLYLTGAYELHKKVNRTSDMPNLDPNDVADEDARKGGIQYAFPTGTTISAIYEDMRRYVPAYLQFQNERTRTGHWLALTQDLTKKDSLSFGWAHANATPGDPGQHNTAGGAHPDNAANMYTAAYKHKVDSHFSWYVDSAMTFNHPDAHYDLGAGGRGLTTDCHDGSPIAAFDPTTGTVTGTGPHCYAGSILRGFSAGVDVKF